MRGANRVPWLALCLVATGCGAGGGDERLSESAKLGQHSYQNVCIACHNGNPAEVGSLGPAVAGASRALVEAKVVHGTYPPGYEPQRDTQAMPKFEYLADQVDNIAAYLDEVRRSGG